MTGLERRCRWLLRAYPAWYRRERSGEMLGTLLEASPPGRRWPTFRDARALITGSFRVRCWVWLLSMLWVGAGAVYAGYFFYITTKPWPGIDLGIVGWAEIPVTFQIVIALATFVLCAALVPVPIAGFIRLRGWRRGNWLRAAAWPGAWIAGVALLLLASSWAQYPLHSCPNAPGPVVPPQCPYGSPAVVSWGELPICAAWLVLGILMTWILAVPPARRSDVPSTSRQASGKAS
ncbi:MAG: hypothetical protein ACLP36_12450 [Acidimicrobiales bacterium]